MKKIALILALSVLALPAFATVSNPNKYTSATVGTASAQVLAQATSRIFLDIANQSATATIACRFGATPAINGAGSITIPPLWHRSWEENFIPTDAINCIASGAATPVTIGYQ